MGGWVGELTCRRPLEERRGMPANTERRKRATVAWLTVVSQRLVKSSSASTVVGGWVGGWLRR